MDQSLCGLSKSAGVNEDPLSTCMKQIEAQSLFSIVLRPKITEGAFRLPIGCMIIPPVE